LRRARRDDRTTRRDRDARAAAVGRVRPRRARGAGDRAHARPAEARDRQRLLRARARRALRRLRRARRRPLHARRLDGGVPAGPARRDLACSVAREGDVSRRARIVVVLPALAGLAALLAWSFTGLPGFGSFRGPYGILLNRVATPERHMTNVVNATTYDYRSFDTMGEEFILFAAVIGIVLLLREDDRDRRAEDRVRSEMVRSGGGLTVGIGVLVALWVVAFGFVTPGGGLQAAWRWRRRSFSSSPRSATARGRRSATRRCSTPSRGSAPEATSPWGLRRSRRGCRS